MSGNLCPNCGTPNLPQARFCAKCGKALAAPPAAPSSSGAACPRCHVPIRSTARFCPSCGYNLIQMAEPAAAAAQQPLGPSPAAAQPPLASSPAPATQMLGASSGPPTLVVRWMGGNTQSYPLTKPVISLGRAPENDIVINHPAVSGRHMSLTTGGGVIAVTDLNSTNGTQLNGQRIPPNVAHPFKPGDVIRIGDLTGNWVGLALESEEGMVVRTLSMGKLDLSNTTSVVIGRDPSCYLPLNHPSVSFRHATILKQNGGLIIRDLGSTNGTFVNGTRITQTPLKSGDEIQIGPFKLVYDSQQQSLAQSMRLGHRLDAIRLGREVANNRFILQNVTLCVQPGEFIALVGGSGAGKTTLMKAMNGYEPANHGQMLLDGEPFYPKLDLYRTQMGYVPQDDIIHRELPVHLALWYAAKLRLPDARPAEIEARIKDALRAVDMTEHAHKPVRVLSGGQRKRVSIAVELLARPTLFFLDEPTSGLDPGLEKKMMYDLNRLADEGRTVVLVTHATANIEQCDHVAFLSQGRLSYYGPPNEALNFFNVRDFSDIYLKLSQEIDPARGKPPPPELQPYYAARSNPAQAGAKGASSGGRMVAGVLWADHFQKSSHFQKNVVERQKRLGSIAQGNAAAVQAPLRRSRDSFLRQMFILARRQLDLIRMDWRTLSILLLMVPLIALLFMSVSAENDLVGRKGTMAQIEANMKKELEGKPVDSKVDYIPTQAAQTLITMVTLAITQAGTFAAAYEIVKERAIYRRERAVNLSAIAYVMSKIIVLSMFAFIQVASMILILAMRVDMGFRGAIIETGALEIFVTMYLAVVASIAFGLFISAIVPSSDVVLYAILVQLFIQIILSGTLFPLDNNPASLITIGYWATDSIGSTIDLPQLNKQGRVCSVIEVEIPSFTGEAPKKEIRTECDKAEGDLFLDYEHSEGHIMYTWTGLIIHTIMWTLMTMIIQARKKAE